MNQFPNPPPDPRPTEIWDKSSSKLSSNVSLVMSCDAGKLEKKTWWSLCKGSPILHESIITNSSSEHVWKWDAYVHWIGYLRIPYDQLEVSIAVAETWCFMKYHELMYQIVTIVLTCFSIAWMDKRGQLKRKQNIMIEKHLYMHIYMYTYDNEIQHV